MSNEDISETCTHLQIASNRTKVDKKQQQQQLTNPRNMYRSVDQMSKEFLRKIDIFGFGKIKHQVKYRILPVIYSFNRWTIPNYFIDCCTKKISNLFMLNSDCDVIYSK